MNKTMENVKGMETEGMLGYENGKVTIDLHEMKGHAINTAKKLENGTKQTIEWIISHICLNKMVILKSILMLAMLFTGYISIMCMLNNVGYNKPLKELKRVVNQREVELDEIAKSILPNSTYEDFNQIMDSLGEVDALENEVNRVEEQLDQAYLTLDDQFGSNAKVSYKVLSKEKMSKSQLRKAEREYHEYYSSYFQAIEEKLDSYGLVDRNNLAERLDITNLQLGRAIDAFDSIAEDMESADIKKGYNLNLEINVEGARDEYTEEVEMKVIKINGEWMIDYTSNNITNGIFRNLGSKISGLSWYL